MYRQLVQPNLSVSGRIGWCLEYADKVAGLNGGEPSAWDAWNMTEFPHVDAIPTDVAVPCWFSYFTPEEVNLGHVVWSIPGQGFYSSPYNKPTGHNVLSSIAEVERLYGCRYVGWSEDISDLRVVEGGDMDDKDTLGIYEVAGRNYQSVTQADYDYYRGQKPEMLTNDLKKSKEWKDFSYKGSHYDTDVKDAYERGLKDGGGSGTELKPGKYLVK